VLTGGRKPGGCRCVLPLALLRLCPPPRSIPLHLLDELRGVHNLSPAHHKEFVARRRDERVRVSHRPALIEATGAAAAGCPSVTRDCKGSESFIPHCQITASWGTAPSRKAALVRRLPVVPPGA
jgi:hypothetical protein